MTTRGQKTCLSLHPRKKRPPRERGLKVFCGLCCTFFEKVSRNPKDRFVPDRYFFFSWDMYKFDTDAQHCLTVHKRAEKMKPSDKKLRKLFKDMKVKKKIRVKLQQHFFYATVTFFFFFDYLVFLKFSLLTFLKWY